MDKPQVTNPTTTLQPVFDSLFRFKIGDVVATYVEAKTFDGEREVNARDEEQSKRYEWTERRSRAPAALIVTGRRIDECHGGMQMFYSLTGYNSTSKGTIVDILLTEFALVPYDVARDAARAMVVAGEKDAE